MDMMQRCADLMEILHQKIDPEHNIDVLGKYRKWFDERGIESEKEDGWPEEFVFDEKNINAFVEYWMGE